MNEVYDDVEEIMTPFQLPGIREPVSKCRGRVTSFYQDGGREIELSVQENLVLFSAADINAQLLAGNVEFKVSGMYFEFINGLSPGSQSIPSPVFDRTRSISYYTSLLDPQGYSRVPIVANPKLSSTLATFQSNRVTFVAVTDGTSEPSGAALIADDSIFYSVALVSIVNFNDKTQDVLFSVVNLTTSRQHISGIEFGIRWDIDFL